MQTSVSRTRWLAVPAVVLVLAAVVWWSASTGSPESDTSSDTSTTPTTPADAANAGSDRPPIIAIGEPIESQNPWPDPPVDFDPHLVFVPGRGPLVADPGDAAILYVNSIGRPTLVDLATGDRTEIEVATTRDYDRVAVEGGTVRLLVGGIEPVRLGESAIVVHLHRPSAGAVIAPETTAAGVHLCLADTCPQLVPSVGPLAAAVGDVELLDPVADGEIGALVLDRTDVDGRFDLIAVGDATYRLPTPGPGAIWVIHGATRSGGAPGAGDV